MAYIYREKYNSDDVTICSPLGGKYPYGALGISSDFKYIDTLSIATRKFTEIEQYKNHHIAINYHLGGGVSPISWGIGTLNCLDTLPMERKFTDVNFFDYERDGYGRKTHGMVSYIWSKHYGLLQYTTADSLVWTRINIEEPEE